MVVKTIRSFSTSNHTKSNEENELVKDSWDMKKLLENHVRLRFYTATNNNNSYATITNNSGILIYLHNCYSCTEADDADAYFQFFEKNYFLLAILGVISLLGNGVTIFHQIKTISRQSATEKKERRNYDVLVLNLCLAHGLFGAFLFAAPFALVLWKPVSASTCNALGVLSVLSVHVSIATLVIITAYRLYAILFPFKQIHLRLTVILLIFVWLVWLVIVSVPLFNKTIFAHDFTREIKLSDDDKQANVHQPITRATRITRQLSNHGLSAVIDKPFNQFLNSLNYHEKSKVAEQLLKNFNLIDYESEKASIFGYYSPSRICSLDVLVDAENTTSTKLFTICLLTVKLTEYIFIIIAHLVMYNKISSSHLKCFKPIRFLTKINPNNQEPKSNKIKVENNAVYAKLLIVIITDLICDIPICVLGLTYTFNGLFDDCFSNDFLKLFASIITLVFYPLNCVVNPYIYSFYLWKRIFNRFIQLLPNCNLHKKMVVKHETCNASI